MCKEYGGLGIPNLRDLNICLLTSWLRRYENDRDKLWRQLLDHKYQTCRPNIFQAKTLGSSEFFKGFMWSIQASKMGYIWKIGNGRKVCFGEDNWLGSSSLAIQYWELHRIVNEKSKTIAKLWDGVNLKCTLRRLVDGRLFSYVGRSFSVSNNYFL
jgi:hypothetical protein